MTARISLIRERTRGHRPRLQWSGLCIEACGGSMAKFLGFAAALIIAGACIAAPQQSRYQLKNGDTLDLTFAYVPEFNQTVTIQPDGYVTLRAAGEVRAGGLTLPELKKAVETKYGAMLKEPDVS